LNVADEVWRLEKKGMFTFPEKEPRLFAQSASPYPGYYTDPERMEEIMYRAFLN
jgi:hypothetical protein